MIYSQRPEVCTRCISQIHHRQANAAHHHHHGTECTMALMETEECVDVGRFRETRSPRTTYCGGNLPTSGADVSRRAQDAKISASAPAWTHPCPGCVAIVTLVRRLLPAAHITYITMSIAERRTCLRYIYIYNGGFVLLGY